MGCHFLVQGIFQTQELDQGLLHCRRIPASQADSLPRELQGKPLIIETGSQIHHCLLLGARLLTPDLSLDAILFTQFVHKITEEEAKEEIWSSVNYLFLIFTSLVYGKNQHVKLSIV